jgi:hypothetical protein
MTTKVSSSVLANTTVTAGIYGGANSIPVVVVDAQGRLTLASNAAISIGNTSVVAGTYGGGGNTAVIVVNSEGRLTFAANTPSSTQRVVASTSTSGTITPRASTSDVFTMLGLTGSVTVAAPSGTPTNGQKLILRIRDNGTARTLSWANTSGGYRAIGITLPTTTIPNKIAYVGCIYNTTDTFWDVIAYTQEV